jgi:hypothetical protein
MNRAVGVARLSGLPDFACSSPIQQCSALTADDLPSRLLLRPAQNFNQSYSLSFQSNRWMLRTRGTAAAINCFIIDLSVVNGYLFTASANRLINAGRDQTVASLLRRKPFTVSKLIFLPASLSPNSRGSPPLRGGGSILRCRLTNLRPHGPSL